MNIPHNLYIHVPFCVSKCKYCAFFSRACATPDWDKYATDIIQEIKLFGERLGNITVPTIFFGGGTPSLMPTRVFANIMDEIRKNFNVAQDTEITIEANPKTLDTKKLDEFCNLGVSRLSVGVQSLDDNKLKFLGRIHTAADAIKLLDAALHRNIRVSADFIYGLPGDSYKDVIKICDDINNIGLSHCSMYELTLEHGTPLWNMKPEMPSNEEMAEMYAAIQTHLYLPRYEVSNYARTGNECRHNQNVWDGEPYIGIGNGAAGRIKIDDVWYEQLGGNKMFTPMSTSSRAIERIITGLRTIRGVKLDEQIRDVINLEFAKSHPDMLQFVGDDRIAATDAGMMVLDNLISQLVK